MPKGKRLVKEIKAMRDRKPSWLKLPKKEILTYTIVYDTKTKHTMVFRGVYFTLPQGTAEENLDLVDIAKAPSVSGITGDYIDFLLEGERDRFQTIRSLLTEVFGVENPG